MRDVCPNGPCRVKGPLKVLIWVLKIFAQSGFQVLILISIAGKNKGKFFVFLTSKLTNIQ